MYAFSTTRISQWAQCVCYNVMEDAETQFTATPGCQPMAYQHQHPLIHPSSILIFTFLTLPRNITPFVSL